MGWACTSQLSPMPHWASKKVGRSGHGLRFRRGTAAPEAVVQPQSGQGHTQSRTCTSQPRFRAHAGLFHMCGPRAASDARPESGQPSPQAFVRATLLPTPDNAPEPFASGRARPVGQPATGQTPTRRRTFFRADRAVHHERNRMMARTKRSRRSYGAGEWGRNRVRVFPDRKTGLYQIKWREKRAQAHPVPQAPRLVAGKAAGRRVRRA